MDRVGRRERSANVGAAVEHLEAFLRQAGLEQELANLLLTAGACGGGLTIVLLPAAKQAASLCASRLTGALNGVMARTVPTGARKVSAVLPTPRGQPATGSSSPPSWRACSAATASVSATRSISPSQSLSGLPSSIATITASSRARAATSSAARSRTSARA